MGEGWFYFEVESRVLFATGLIGEDMTAVECQEVEEGVPLSTNLASGRFVNYGTACHSLVNKSIWLVCGFLHSLILPC